MMLKMVDSVCRNVNSRKFFLGFEVVLLVLHQSITNHSDVCSHGDVALSTTTRMNGGLGG